MGTTMATLYYGTDFTPIEMPEHLLAHVKIVIATKLRRNESFMMSWRHSGDSGRSSIWIQPSIPLRFEFETPESPEIDRDLLETLAHAASSTSGLIVHIDDLAQATAEATRTPERAAVPAGV